MQKLKSYMKMLQTMFVNDRNSNLKDISTSFILEKLPENLKEIRKLSSLGSFWAQIKLTGKRIYQKIVSQWLNIKQRKCR